MTQPSEPLATAEACPHQTRILSPTDGRADGFDRGTGIDWLAYELPALLAVMRHGYTAAYEHEGTGPAFASLLADVQTLAEAAVEAVTMQRWVPVAVEHAAGTERSEDYLAALRDLARVVTAADSEGGFNGASWARGFAVLGAELLRHLGSLDADAPSAASGPPSSAPSAEAGPSISDLREKLDRARLPE